MPACGAALVPVQAGFTASRYDRETMEGASDEGSYLNCPMDKEEYEAFIEALTTADQFHGHEFDEVPYFEGCMPAEEIASRGPIGAFAVAGIAIAWLITMNRPGSSRPSDAWH